MSAPAFYDELRALRLERLLDASVAIITDEGWDRLTMTRVAEQSGVPRQSLYKEVGTRADLGEAVVRREVDRFLSDVRRSIEARPDSVGAGLTAAARAALEHGETNTLLQAILQPGADAALLSLVTVRPDAVLGQAVSAVAETLQQVHGAPRDTEERASVVDSMVRLTLSHLVQPTVSTDVAVARVARAVGHRG